LIVNELVTYMAKYAFPGDNTGEFSIHLKSDNENRYELTVADDGIGFSKDFDWRESDSLGLTLVKLMVENQLDGTLDIESKIGTTFIIKFIANETL
jgi:two-component sensor histidine kinase